VCNQKAEFYKFIVVIASYKPVLRPTGMFFGAMSKDKCSDACRWAFRSNNHCRNAATTNTYISYPALFINFIYNKKSPPVWKWLLLSP